MSRRFRGLFFTCRGLAVLCFFNNRWSCAGYATEDMPALHGSGRSHASESSLAPAASMQLYISRAPCRECFGGFGACAPQFSVS